MKSIMKTTIAAIALIGVSAAANAACPDGASNYPGGVASFPFATTGISFAVDTPTAEFLAGESYASYDSDCHTPLGFGIGESTTGEIVDAGGGAGFYSHSPSITVGPNNSAFGNGSSVYAEETYTHPGPDGIPGNADDEQRTRIIPVSNGTAIGAKSHVSHDNSTAIGAGAQSTDDHQVTLGTKDETVRAEGITSAKSKDRQQGPVELVTSDSGGRLATDGGETFNRIDTNAENIAINSGDIATNASGIAANSVLIDELTGGLAAVAAMPDSYLNPDENFALAAGFGGYSDKTAFGVLGTARLTNNLSAYGGASIPLDDGDIAWKVGGRVGF